MSEKIGVGLRVGTAGVSALGAIVIALGRPHFETRTAHPLVTLDLVCALAALVGWLVGTVAEWRMRPLVLAASARLDKWCERANVPVPDESRAFGVGLVVGAARGSIAGAVTFLLAALVVAFPTLAATLLFLGVPAVVAWLEWKNPRLLGRSALGGVALGWVVIGGAAVLVSVFGVGGALAHYLDHEDDAWSQGLAIAIAIGASLAAGEAASTRIGPTIERRIARALGGLLSPVAVAAAIVLHAAFFAGVLPSHEALKLTRRGLDTEAALMFGALGVGLAIGELVAGAPHAGASREAKLRRAVRFVLGFSAAAAIGATPLLHTGALLLPALFAASVVTTAAVVALYAIGLLVARPFALRVSRWLEPGHAFLDRRQRDRAREQHGVAAEQALKTRELERATDEARSALDLAVVDGALLVTRREDLRRYIELLLESGRLEDVARLPRELPYLGVLEAEVLRLRGEPARAIALLRAGLREGTLPFGARSGAHAVLALAEAELGHFELARSELAGLHVTSRVSEPLLKRHRVTAVSREVERCEALAGEAARVANAADARVADAGVVETSGSRDKPLTPMRGSRVS